MPQSRQALTLEQEPYLDVRCFACGYSNGTSIQPHRHDWHQLVYATTGAMSVTAARQSWMIPPGKAVFVPAGCGHSIRMWGSVAMRSLVFPRYLTAGECRVISVTPLLRELILRVVEMQALDSRVAAHRRLRDLVLDEMNAAPEEPLTLPLPEDARALKVARRVLAHPGGEETLDDLARRYGAGRRTLERLFRAQTGMSFGLWRQKARMLDSVRALSAEKPVTEAALDAGYASVSAYIAAFKKTFGCTPGQLS
jgi:AraC-like DNA-binding protein/mannose-6-phosphate isomerase-like protein (cupin superfamily)